MKERNVLPSNRTGLFSSIALIAEIRNSDMEFCDIWNFFKQFSGRRLRDSHYVLTGTELTSLALMPDELRLAPADERAEEGPARAPVQARGLVARWTLEMEN